MKRTCASTTLKDFGRLKEALQTRHCIRGQDVKPRSGVDSKMKSRTDDEVFLDAMADVREIKEFREIPLRKAPRTKPRLLRREDDLKVLREILSGRRKIRLSDTGEYMEWTTPEVRRDITERLHRGDFSVQDCIDLHGMTVDEAEEALVLFFREALRKNMFCVKVIHGRGLRSPRGPVLKEALKRWLHGSFSKWTAAYATAKDCDGGLGATYIILKSR
ncbi:MAG TPA: Smr/MutS family protein [Thermodesulfovibrionales bacterium]|nr:Smr/MutS family protein [Thermodesulfovibrionales bacterium]